jgi:type III secretion protein V
MLNPRDILGRWSDLVLAVAVTLGVCLLIIKVPTPVMDLLLVTNLAISAIVLLVALYTPDARRLPAFPTILLLTTLLRLALNVSSTRLILLDADAGRVIESFGRVVVGGNFIVGGVVFLVLVIVQFVVIARGGERVAEVAARFTLDAMPGKQMSIDAEVRGGLLSADQARDKRAELERESRLYGAMDGAMKFVKGDAIAGVVISAVNIIGGLLIGIFQKDLPAANAAQVYSLLTIGDGLCAQIPSILTSVAAGLVVTRVASAEGTPVGSDLARQFFFQPRVMALVGLALLALGVLPLGFPRSPFLMLGLVCIAMSLMTFRSVLRDERVLAKAKAPATAGLPAAACVLRVHPDLARLVDREALESTLSQVTTGVCDDLGIRLSSRAVVVSESGVESGGFAVELHDAPVAVKRPAMGDRIAALGEMATALDRSLRTHAASFVSITAVHQMLELIRSTEEGTQLVRAVTPSPLTLQQVAEVFQRLVREDVPVRQVSAILESLAKWGPSIKNPQYLVERVRRDMASVIAARFCSAPGRLTYFSLSPDVEDLIRGSVEDFSEGQVVSMSNEQRARLVAACSTVLGQAGRSSHAPVLMVENASIRRPLKTIIERQLPDVVVMSYDELPREMTVVNAGMVELLEANLADR